MAFQRAGALFSGKMAEAGEIPAVGAYLCGVCRADRLDFLPRGHDRAGIFLYPVYVCAAQRSRSDGTLHEPETLDVSKAALLACGPVQWFWMKWKGRVLAQDGSVTVTSWIGYMAILWFSILLLVNNTYNPFIYFRF